MLDKHFLRNKADLAKCTFRNFIRVQVCPKGLEAAFVSEFVWVDADSMTVAVSVVGKQLCVGFDGLADSVEDLRFKLNGHNILLV